MLESGPAWGMFVEPLLFMVLPVVVCLGLTFAVVRWNWRRSGALYPNPQSFRTALRFAFSKQGLLGTVWVPCFSAFCFYAFVLHIRWVLGRWPHFGEALAPGILSVHAGIMHHLVVGMIYSLFPLSLIFLIALFSKKGRWFSFCCVTYAIWVGLSCASILLAPDRFLNWYFD